MLSRVQQHSEALCALELEGQLRGLTTPHTFTSTHLQTGDSHNTMQKSPGWQAFMKCDQRLGEATTSQLTESPIADQRAPPSLL